MTSTEFLTMVRKGDVVSLHTRQGVGLINRSATDLSECVMYAVTEDTGLQHRKHNSLLDNPAK